MNRQQKYLKKKKEKEEKNKRHRLARERDAAGKRQGERQVYLQHRHMVQAHRERLRLESIADEVMAKLPDEVRKKIENNIDILKALEEEYERELNQKKVLNSKLEEQGHHTLEEKLNALRSAPLDRENGTGDSAATGAGGSLFTGTPECANAGSHADGVAATQENGVPA